MWTKNQVWISIAKFATLNSVRWWDLANTAAKMCEFSVCWVENNGQTGMGRSLDTFIVDTLPKSDALQAAHHNMLLVNRGLSRDESFNGDLLISRYNDTKRWVIAIFLVQIICVLQWQFLYIIFVILRWGCRPVSNSHKAKLDISYRLENIYWQRRFFPFIL